MRGFAVSNRWLGFAVSLAVSLLGVLDLADHATASIPWWHITTISSPAGTNSDRSSINVDIANVGDAPTSGTWLAHLQEAVFAEEDKSFISVTDKLPAGVEIVEVHPEGGGNITGRTLEKEMETLFVVFEGFGFKPPKLCNVTGLVATGQTVVCKYGTPVRPFEHIILGLSVKVAPGKGHGVSEVDVSGGGAASASSRRALSLDGVGSFGVQTYELSPEEEGGSSDTQAGSHPFQLTTTLMFDTENSFLPNLLAGEESHYEVRPMAMAKDLRLNLPPGLVGNPTPLPKCSVKQFTLIAELGVPKPLCPNSTVVGVAVPLLDFRRNGESLFVPYAISQPVYNLEPSVGEPAKFGFQTLLGPVVLDTSVRTGGDYGLVVTAPNITQDLAFIGSVVTLWGVPADERHASARNSCVNFEQPTPGAPEPSCEVGEKEQPFVILPTVCEKPWHSSVEADSWERAGMFTEPFEYVFQNSAGELLAQDGCNRLNFEPSIRVAADGTQASTPTGLTVGVHVAQEASLNPTGLADSTVRKITVTLPAGVAVNPASADGLQACGLGEVGLESPAEQVCPEASKVGTVEIRTPLLPNPLTGAVYLAQQYANPFGSLLAMYIVVKDSVSGVIVKLAGQVALDPATGQLTGTFENPPLPFEDARLDFFGGARAPLGTPALCGSYAASATVTPWSGNPASKITSPPFSISNGPNGSACANPLSFDPAVTTGSLNVQAGAFTPFTMTMSREDGQQNLDAVRLRMPPGLSGLLTGVKLCGEAQANAGTCSPESLIGETTVSVGLGPNPYAVKGGKVYLTGPYQGAPFGLSIVNPTKAGPFDLGQVVVRARIEVDPITAALTVTSDATGPYAIPQILDGIPLQIKHVNVTIDRSGFTFNPTNCSKLAIVGTLTSSQGATRTLNVPFQVTNCATLAFKPKLTVTTTGRTSRANGASLHVKLTYPKAPFGLQTNIAQVKIALPKQLPSRLSTLQKACVSAIFEKNPADCPPASRVGTVKATTPLLPVSLNGPAYFVSNGGARFPELVIVLSGYGVTVQLHGETFISRRGITNSTFHTIPDVPVGTFELTLPQGAGSALAANGNLCTHKLRMPTVFVAQNGRTIHESTPIAVVHCIRHRKG